jgi:uncharacterized protein YjbI with pentapeptide repeats
MNRAVLRGADLTDTHLEGIRFHKADLKMASFVNANLEWARLTNLGSTNKANFQSADLTGASLEHSDFREARGLTQPQINSAQGNGETQLPKGLMKPDEWPN